MLFLADSLHGGNTPDQIKYAIQFPVHDPVALVTYLSAMEKIQRKAKTGGGKKGTLNKTSAALKDAIIEAADTAGVSEGLIEYLVVQARENPVAFMGLGKLVSSQFAGEVTQCVATVTAGIMTPEEWEGYLNGLREKADVTLNRVLASLAVNRMNVSEFLETFNHSSAR